MEVGVYAFHMIRQKDDRVLQVIPFNSARKRACTAIRHPTLEGVVRVYVKGAPEIVFELCESYFDKEGNVKDLNTHQRENIINNIVTNTFAKKAYRTLLVAYTDLSVQEYETLMEQNNNF